MSKSDRFPSWKPFEHAKALAHRMKENGIWEAFRSWTNSHMNYLEPTMSLHGTILTLHTAVNVIIGSMKRYYDKTMISKVILETIKLAVSCQKAMSVAICYVDVVVVVIKLLCHCD